MALATSMHLKQETKLVTAPTPVFDEKILPVICKELAAREKVFSKIIQRFGYPPFLETACKFRNACPLYFGTTGIAGIGIGCIKQTQRAAWRDHSTFASFA